MAKKQVHVSHYRNVFKCVNINNLELLEMVDGLVRQASRDRAYLGES